ncbi:MAG: site-specific integrase [Desulfobacteraceae bacterium]|nr:MAG: site-specific integrase [Desulfobacteraceae bacterium]
MAGDSEQRDYLWTIAFSLARVNEVNALLWDDIDFKKNTITFYTRKKKGGNRTGHLIPMNEKLLSIMTRRFESRDKTKPWVFWHHYFDRKQRAWIDKPYVERSMLMETLCEKAGVRHFGFHALRHFGASQLDQAGVLLGSIQRILGHENRSTTEIYLHSVGEGERSAMDILNGELKIFTDILKKEFSGSV